MKILRENFDNLFETMNESERANFVIEGGVLKKYLGNDREVVIPDGVTEIDGAFENYTDLTSVTIPNGVTKIGDYAFCGCANLTNINIPDSVVLISRYAFCGCKNLTNIVIPNNVIGIGFLAFGHCTNLTNITIPDSVERIGKGGKWAFDDCPNLTITCHRGSCIEYYARKNDIPVEYMEGEEDALEGENQNDLSDFEIKGNILIKYLGKEKEVVVPTRGNDRRVIRMIDDDAFRNCKNLTDVTIPDGVKTIGDCAFYGCKNLTNIKIPDSVTIIDRRVFDNCPRLTITCHRSSKIDEYAQKNDIPVKYI